MKKNTTFRKDIVLNALRRNKDYEFDFDEENYVIFRPVGVERWYNMVVRVSDQVSSEQFEQINHLCEVKLELFEHLMLKENVDRTR